MTVLLDQTRTPVTSGREHAQSRTDVPPGVERIAVGQEFLAARFAQLEALTADWDGYGARAIDAGSARRARTVAEGTLHLQLPLPQVVPVPDGGVQLEWSVSDFQLEVEFPPSGSNAIFIADDDNSGQRFDGVLPDDLNIFALAVGRLMRASSRRDHR